MNDYISKNLQLHFSLVPSQTEGMEVVHTDSLTFVDSGLPCDTFNVIHIRNAAMLQEDELKKAIEHFPLFNQKHLCINSLQRIPYLIIKL